MASARTPSARRTAGRGWPGTGWSTEHGDLRVPHFLGLHGFQALPLLVLAARRRGWSERQNVRLIVAAAASYVLLFAVLLAEALRGYSIARPDGTTLLALARMGDRLRRGGCVCARGGRAGFTTGALRTTCLPINCSRC